MLCLACGAEMRLVEVVEDTTMLVSGYEHQTWQCSGCDSVEQRTTFIRKKPFDEKLRNLMQRATALKEAAAENRQRARPRTIPKTQEPNAAPVQSPAEPVAPPAPTAHDEPITPTRERAPPAPTAHDEPITPTSERAPPAPTAHDKRIASPTSERAPPAPTAHDEPITPTRERARRWSWRELVRLGVAQVR